MRILIVGASGFIGRYLIRRLGDLNGHDVFGTFFSRPPAADGNSWHRVDLTDRSEVERLCQTSRPEVVVHLAAMADVGACERDPTAATSINVDATATIARLCRQEDAKLIFVSTEYVFDGLRGFYSEDDAPNPTTHYGRTKREAEREVARLASNWSIVRTSIVYGWPAPGRRNFVTWLIERLRSGQQYVGSIEVLRTPVYVEHLVDGISALVEADHQGIQHVSGRDWVSMFDFALAVAEGFNLDRNLVVAENTAPGGPESKDITASERLGLDSTSTMRALGLPQPGLTEGLAAMRAASESK